MKSRALLLAVLLSAGALLAGCAAQPPAAAAPAAPAPFNVAAARPTLPFSPSVLSAEQLAACAAFRANQSGSRRSEWEAILRLGALPYPTWRMSEADIIALLGPPLEREARGGRVELRYQFENTQRQSVLTIQFQEGYAIMLLSTTSIS